MVWPRGCGYMDTKSFGREDCGCRRRELLESECPARVRPGVVKRGAPAAGRVAGGACGGGLTAGVWRCTRTVVAGADI